MHFCVSMYSFFYILGTFFLYKTDLAGTNNPSMNK